MRKATLFAAALIVAFGGSFASAELTITVDSADIANITKNAGVYGVEVDIVGGNNAANAQLRATGERAIQFAFIHSDGDFVRHNSNVTTSFAEAVANMDPDKLKACLSSTNLSPLAAQTHAENWLKAVASGADLDTLDSTRQMLNDIMKNSVREMQCFPAGDMMQSLSPTASTGGSVSGNAIAE